MISFVFLPSVLPEDISSDSDDEGVVTIKSPIRVSPDRHRRRSGERKSRRERDKDSAKTKMLSVKDRLFVSKKVILGKYNRCGLD